jgi:predicted O-methyltransferase YrrM
LAAQANGPVLELGSGCGVSSAWLISGLRNNQPFISIDQHTERQAYLQHHFSKGDDTNITFMTGNWPAALTHRPFQLVFVDIASAKDVCEGTTYGPADVIAATAVGGLLVLDDFEPGPLFQGQPDTRWRYWMNHPQLTTCEVLTTPTSAMLLAARVH